MKSIVTMKKEVNQLPEYTRGQVAQQEQIRILKEVEALAGKTKEQVPQTRGQVAQQEQIRILKEALGMRDRNVPQNSRRIMHSEFILRS